MNMELFRRFALVALICAGLIVGATSDKALAGPAQKPRRVIIVVDGRGYTPSTVNAVSGQPVQLVFVSKSSTCANTIRFSGIHKTITLNPGDTRTLTLTPKKEQKVSFACGMQMFKGKVVAR